MRKEIIRRSLAATRVLPGVVAGLVRERNTDHGIWSTDPGKGAQNIPAKFVEKQVY
jgi:hypothetical protein